MKLLARMVAAGALFAALVVPAVALGQAQQGALRLTPLPPTNSFPDRNYVLELPDTRALTADQLTVTENGGAVVGVGVRAPGGAASGAVLLIDASNSMAGAPIQNAVDAARAFLDERNDDLAVAILAFNPTQTVLTDFTTDREELATAVAEPPTLGEGTTIYDTLVRAAELTEAQGLERATVVLLSDGTDIGSQASRGEALAALADANIRVISVGLSSPQYDPEALRVLAARTSGTYVETATPGELEPIFEEIGQQLSREYEVTYRSLLPSDVEANVQVAVAGYATPAVTTYTTPTIDFGARGTFEREWIDEVIVSPWLMVFVIVAVLTLIAFAILTVVDVRRRSLRRRMAQYVSVPSEEESKARRAEVTAMLAEKAQQRVGRFRSWQAFEADVDVAGFRVTPLAIAAWTIVGGILASLVGALVLQSLWGLLLGLLAPFVTRWFVSWKVSKTRKAFEDQLADNLDVLAGAMRTGHSIMGALSVMVESADEPSKSEFRRVLSDEQLGVPLDDALTVMARRMQSQDGEQVALVMKLQREAGGNTAEVLDRVAETVRGRAELRRLVDVLTAQARISRWILTGLPIFVLFSLMFTGGDYLDPMLGSLIGRIFLVVGALLVVIGSLWIKRIAKMDV